MLRTRLLQIACLLMVGSLAGIVPAQRMDTASRDQRGTEAMASLGAEMVLPSVADPGLVTKYDNPNVVAMPKGTPKPELVLLIPGTGGKPAQYSLLIKSLSGYGFRVIGLMYNDTPTEGMACEKTGDLECHRHFREERFAGDAPTATVSNTAREGIDHRLVMLLKYLDKERPADGWGKYLDGGEPAWKKIIVTGHSQGSGHATYIAKTHEVARVVLFSGPYDAIDLRTTPKMSTWLSETSKTPMDRWYAEYHEKDLVAQAPPLTLAALKVPSEHIIVSHLEPNVAPEVMARAQAKTALAPTATLYYHSMGTHDPRMEPQWKWLFGVEGGVK